MTKHLFILQSLQSLNNSKRDGHWEAKSQVSWHPKADCQGLASFSKPCDTPTLQITGP